MTSGATSVAYCWERGATAPFSLSCHFIFIKFLYFCTIKTKHMKVAEVKLSYTTKVKAADRHLVSRSRDAYDYMNAVYEPGSIEHRETFYLMLLNNGNRVLGHVMIGQGGITGTVADVRLIMQAAILSNAVGIILCHNHPSGNMQPSDADIKMTKKVKAACEIMEIRLLDHLILSPYGAYYSMAEEGII